MTTSSSDSNSPKEKKESTSLHENKQCRSNQEKKQLEEESVWVRRFIALFMAVTAAAVSWGFVGFYLWMILFNSQSIEKDPTCLILLVIHFTGSVVLNIVSYDLGCRIKNRNSIKQEEFVWERMCIVLFVADVVNWVSVGYCLLMILFNSQPIEKNPTYMIVLVVCFTGGVVLTILLYKLGCLSKRQDAGKQGLSSSHSAGDV